MRGTAIDKQNFLFFKFKDVIKQEVGSHILYELICSYCGATYYGKSQRHFYVGASKHLMISPLTGKFLKIIKKSTIFGDILSEIHACS